MNEFNYDNEILETETEDTLKKEDLEEVVEVLDTEDAKTTSKKNKKKKSLKEKWQDTPKKKKIIIIVSSILGLLLIIGIIIYFVIFRKPEEKPQDDPIVLEKENYRYEDGKLIFLDKSDKTIGEYSCVLKDTEKCFVSKLDYSEDKFDKVISVNENDEIIEKTSSIYNDRFVFINDDDKILLYDISKKEELMEVVSFKPSESNNLVIVQNDKNMYGLIEIKEDTYEYLIRCSYDYLGLVNESLGYLVAKDKDNTYIIDNTGKKLSKNINTTIKSLDDKYIVAANNDNYNLYDYNYTELLSDYDFIGLYDNVIATVKNNRLYMLDSKLNKLHEDGIRLENKNYIKKYVYDEKNKLINTLKSFDISVEGNTLKVTVGSNIEEINILEGSISGATKYLSYFDGKLYFYSDIEKTDLLGTYSCKNKNILSSNSDSLNNCYIYTDSTGVSGIYNNDYVFIYDSPTTDSKTYYLYSLKEKKSKGTYSDLSFANKSEISNEFKPVYTSSSFIIAKSATGNNKGNFGVLEITGSKVSGKVEFKYESIKKEKDYYLLINIDKSYSIYNSSFKKISNEFSYIEIFDNYYVGINNNKLNVYKYDNAIGILESDLTVTSNNFKIDFTNGFNITVDGVTYNYNSEGKALEGE